MFDIGFTELIVIGVVALIVIGPERLPKVARTAGLLYARMQRYVSSVKSDISHEIQLDEMRRIGQTFKESVESTVSGVEQQATVVDAYLREEASNVNNVVTAMAATEGDELSVTPPAMKQAETEHAAQQRLPLDEPDQNALTSPPAGMESARGETAGKTP